MEHDSSRSGYHQPQPVSAGQNEAEDYWDNDDFEEQGAVQASINLIWAQAFTDDGKPGAIGAQGRMPWHLSEDMRHFKELTVSHPVIMGRKTWESLNPKYRPLSNRDNIVVSRDQDFVAPGATVVESLDAALDLARQPAIPDDGLNRSEVWVIGGGQIFDAALPFADRVFMTEIDNRYEADTFAPDIMQYVHAGMWVVEDESDWVAPAQSPDISRFRFITYRKVR